MLTVLNVAYPLALAGRNAVGGAEQILSRLDQALVQAGHRSLVVAAEGSEVEGIHLSTPRQRGPLNDSARRNAWEHHRTRINRALDDWPVDVVHLHGIDFLRYLPPPPVPVLVTLHLPPGWYPPAIFDLHRPQLFLNCVSKSQHRACPRCHYLLPEIENGVPDDLFAARHAKRHFALCLGRICPEKGFHFALDAATKADIPLVIGGEVFQYATHEEYYHREIAPRLDARHRFIGPVGWQRKRRLLAAAKCLLAPSVVPETSSLVAMEALACGTPVIAFPSGALAEIVEHGKTGYLVENARAMAEAIGQTALISAEACRDSGRTRFGLGKMVAKYFEVYRLLSHGGMGGMRPKGVEWMSVWR